AAQVRLRQAEAGAAHAQLAQAQAVVASAQASLNKFTIRAPAAGMIDDTHVRVGEVVRTGSSIATMVDFSDTWVTVYVPEPVLPLVKLGGGAEIRVDGLPNRSLRGVVRRIASQAEFTPKFVQTQEERARTVFAVEIAVPNTERLLKPGMPADARIEVAPNSARAARR
ncbi:MAG: efflux RND transporter periplasmic adaptor subunit, partial [Armatimonadota bacterium]